MIMIPPLSMQRRLQRLSSSSTATGQSASSSSRKNRKGKSTCSCCWPESREADDEWMDANVVRKLPSREWAFDWSRDDLAGVMDTGSKDLQSFSVLRDVFLFLPFHLDTLLAVAGTCRSWRILSDRLPHWRYLLPLRNELLPIMFNLCWQQPSPWTRVYFFDANNDRHYRYKFADGGPEEEFAAPAPCSFPRALRAKSRSCIARCDTCKDLSVTCCQCSVIALAGRAAPNSDDEEDDFLQAEFLKNHCFRRKYEKAKAIDLLRNDHALTEETRSKFYATHTADGNGLDTRSRGKRSGATNNSKGGSTSPTGSNWFQRLSTPIRIYPANDEENDPNDEEMQQQRRRDEISYDDDDDDDRGYNSITNKNNGDEMTPPSSTVVEEPIPSERAGFFTLSPLSVVTAPITAPRLNPLLPRLRSSSPTTTTITSSGSDTDTNNGGGGENDAPVESPHLDPSNEEALAEKIHEALRSFPVRIRRRTVVRHHKMVVDDPGYRHQWMYPALSSFTHHARFLLEKFDEEGSPGFCEKYDVQWVPHVVSVLLVTVWLVLAWTAGYQSGEKEPSQRIADNPDMNTDRPRTDERQFVLLGVLTFVISFAVIVLVYIGFRWRREHLPQITRRWLMTAKGLYLVSATALLCTLCVPLSLLNARVDTAEKLLFLGSVSACDAWSGLPVGGGTAAGSSVTADGAAGLQCKLPSTLLPSNLSGATFMHFPPGTRILYHPPGVPRTVPYAATRASTGASTCTVAANAAVADLEAGHNMSKTDVDRGQIGYYTVFLPPSCQPSPSSPEAVGNATVLILGEFGGCPFWSVSAVNDSASGAGMHPRFHSVLANASGDAAVGNASLVSAELSGAVASPSVSLPCARSDNAMAVVRGAPAHEFHLRVSSGYTPHWTASYYAARQPYDDDGPWGVRPTWRDTLDYQLNGIVALMADQAIFLAHENSASPVVPEQVPPFDGAWSDSGAAPFWTGAHPAGLRRLKDDFTAGTIGITIVVIVLLFAFHGVAWFSVGLSRAVFHFVLLILMLFAFPMTLLFIMMICVESGPETDAEELRFPVVCLATNIQDLTGIYTLVSSLIIAGCVISFLFLIYRNCTAIRELLDSCWRNAKNCVTNCCCNANGDLFCVHRCRKVCRKCCD